MAIATAASALLSLLVAVTILAYSYVQIREEQKRTAEQKAHTEAAQAAAEASLARNRDLMDRMLTRLAEELKDQPYLETVRRELLEEALAYYQGFLLEKGDHPEIRHRAAWAYLRVATIRKMLGQPDAAVRHLDEALPLLRRLTDDFPGDLGYQVSLGAALNEYVHLLSEQGKPAEALPLAEEAVRRQQAALGLRANDPSNRMLLGSQYARLAVISTDLRRYPEARAAADRFLQLFEELTAEFPGDPRYRDLLAQSQYTMGSLLSATGRHPEAESAHRQAIDHYTRLVAEFSSGRRYQKGLATSLYNYGNLLVAARRYGEAAQAYRDALPLWEKLAGEFLRVPDYESRLGTTLNNLALSLPHQGQLAEARELAERAVRHQQAALKVDPESRTYRQFLRNHYITLGKTCLLLRQHEPAAQAAAEAVRVPGDGSVYAHAAHVLAGCVGLAQGEEQRPPEDRAELARRYADQAVDLLRQALAKGAVDRNCLKEDPAFVPLRSHEGFQQFFRK